MKKTIIAFVSVTFIFCSLDGFYLTFLNNKITPQCKNAYNNYVSYMNDINKLALDNGFGAQHIDTFKQFCK